MADQGEHGIPYVGYTWNICRGCSPVSPGCANCFAPRNVARVATPGRPYHGLIKSTSVGPRWTGEVRLAAEILDLPLRMKKPTRIYVTVTGDPFHEAHTTDEIDAWLGGVAAAPWHTFICTTKRAERMREHLSTIRARAGNRFLTPALIGHAAAEAATRGHEKVSDRLHTAANKAAGKDVWPLPNLHLGVSVEDQATADARIPLLLATPAAVRWVSYEPALGPVSFIDHDWTTKDYLRGIETLQGRELALPGKLDWIVVGAESGSGRRPMDLAWARSVRDQCAAAGVAFFFKQASAQKPGTPSGDPDLDGCKAFPR